MIDRATNSEICEFFIYECYSRKQIIRNALTNFEHYFIFVMYLCRIFRNRKSLPIFIGRLCSCISHLKVVVQSLALDSPATVLKHLLGLESGSLPI